MLLLISCPDREPPERAVKTLRAHRTTLYKPIGYEKQRALKRPWEGPDLEESFLLLRGCPLPEHLDRHLARPAALVQHALVHHAGPAAAYD